MKRFIALLIMSMLIHHASNASQHGSLIGEAIETNDIQRYRLQFVKDSVLYTIGGITVIYPITFENNPAVTVSIDLTAAGSIPADTTYTPLITNNGLGSVTITVLKIFDDGTSTTITDTPTNDFVIVNIIAIG